MYQQKTLSKLMEDELVVGFGNSRDAGTGGCQLSKSLKKCQKFCRLLTQSQNNIMTGRFLGQLNLDFVAIINN